MGARLSPKAAPDSRVRPEEIARRIQHRRQGNAGAGARARAEGEQHRGKKDQHHEDAALRPGRHAHPQKPLDKPPCGHELAEHPGQQPRRNNDDARAVADAPHRRFAVFLFVFSEEDPNAQRDPRASPKGLGAAPLRNRQPDEPSHQYDERDQAAEQSAVHLKLLFLHEALLLIRLCVACILFYCRHSIIDNMRYRTP